MHHREAIIRLLFWKEDSHKDACEYECMCVQKWIIKMFSYSAVQKSWGSLCFFIFYYENGETGAVIYLNMLKYTWKYSI